MFHRFIGRVCVRISFERIDDSPHLLVVCFGDGVFQQVPPAVLLRSLDLISGLGARLEHSFRCLEMEDLKRFLFFIDVLTAGVIQHFVRLPGFDFPTWISAA